MTILCITGQPATALPLIAENLHTAGLARARNLQREHQIDLSQWHQRVLASNPKTTTPSRLWEQLAVELIVANIDTPQWGWSDPLSAQLLDFWAQLENSLHFLLVCQSPEELITQAIATGQTLEPENTAALLNQWQNQHKHLLRFHTRNRHNSLLIRACDALANPQQLIATLNQRWGTQLTADNLPQAHPQAHGSALLQHLAGHILTPHNQHNELHDELLASMTPLCADTPIQPPLSTRLLIDSYRQISDRSAEHQTIADLQQQLRQATAEAEKAATQAKDAEDEGELLLHQLHQVQEELENYYLQHQTAAARVQQLEQQAEQLPALQTRLHAETAALKNLQAQLDAQAASLKDQQTRLTAETQAKAQAIQQRDAEEQAKKGVQAQLDAQAASLKDLQTRLAAETQAKAQAIQQRDAEEQAKKGVQTQLDAQAASLKDLQTRLTAETQAKNKVQEQLTRTSAEHQKTTAQAKEAEAEGELLLHQLHQVQEELENYYLKHQASQQQSDQLNDRWKRALLAHPQLQDFDAVTLLSETPQSTHWRLNHLMVNGRLHGPFDFKTVTENGISGFVLPRQSDGTSPLRRWPASAMRESEVTILPTKGGASATQRAAQIVQLSATDWHLLNRLQTVLAQALETDAITLQQTPKAALLSGLKAYQQIMSKSQGLIRFDAAELLGQQHVPGKDVLALRLTTLALNDQGASQLDFQLQANKSEDGRMQSVHLIFGQSSQGHPFEQWQSNTVNTADHPVMALQLSALGWGAELWSQLSPKDKSWIKALTDSLAVIWITLQAQGTRIEPGWPQWLDMASQLRIWSAIPTPAMLPLPLTEPEPAAQPETPADTGTAQTAPTPAAKAGPTRAHTVSPAHVARKHLKNKRKTR